MTFYFIFNNLRFALELMGAVAFLMAAWLTFDSYRLSKDASLAVRAAGLALIALWQVLDALVLGSDALSYLGFALYLCGLLLVVGSFLKQKKLEAHAIVIIPAFAAWGHGLYLAAALLLFVIALLSYRLIKVEFNKTWRPFSLGFALLGVAALASAASATAGDAASVAALLCELAGFGCLARWVWQFLALRMRESLVLMLIASALFLSTLVTLAFSMILVGQVSTQTQMNLLTDARVLNLAVGGLQSQSLAEASLVASSPALSAAISKNDFAGLQSVAEAAMEQYNLGFVTVVDAQGVVLVRAHALSRRGDSLAGERAVSEALLGTPEVTIEDSPVEKFSIRAAAPVMLQGKVVGAVVAGYPLDNALVDGIKRVTGLELFIYSDTTSVAATAFASDGRTRLTGLALADGSVAAQVLGAGQDTTAQTTLVAQPYLMSFLPLQNGDKKIVGMLAAGKPEQDILDLANATNRLTLITVFLIMLLLSVPIYWFSKRLADPL